MPCSPPERRTSTLVDVVQERRRLDQRAVDRDLRLGEESRAGHGHAGDALGVDDDAVGQPGIGQHAPGGGSVGNGHGPMLPRARRRAPARDGTPAGIGPDPVGRGHR